MDKGMKVHTCGACDPAATRRRDTLGACYLPDMNDPVQCAASQPCRKLCSVHRTGMCLSLIGSMTFILLAVPVVLQHTPIWYHPSALSHFVGSCRTRDRSSLESEYESGLWRLPGIQLVAFATSLAAGIASVI
jgi:hypothetical protein